MNFSNHDCCLSILSAHREVFFRTHLEPGMQYPEDDRFDNLGKILPLGDSAFVSVR